MKDLVGKSTPCMVEVSDKEGNDGHQTSTFKFDQQPTSPIQMDFANNDQNIGVSNFVVEDQNHQEMKDVNPFHPSNIHHSSKQSNELTVSQSFLSDSQLPTDIPITTIVVRSNTNTPLARNKMPSQILKSPYLTSFGSSEKGKKVMEDVIRPYFPYEGLEITNRAPNFLIDEYIQWVTKGLLKSHANK
ncbi:hypothetical protein R3W88_000612 [Solanum pinnatisectum]|uniref:Uncharacterized protein n=1 Tax=Solanum pinnatisectum TaxID=50273 RepID=A0AAV9MFU6_9SOLN|nr:hypothetical protein R3W88_000612 [Solanum pinnatisectum]